MDWLGGVSAGYCLVWIGLRCLGCGAAGEQTVFARCRCV